jgi:hypothetical protein
MTQTTSPGQPAAADAAVMGMLHARVPLSLLADLIDPSGPESDRILDTEGRPEWAWWERGEPGR